MSHADPGGIRTQEHPTFNRVLSADAELLAVCDELAALQVEWQTVWAATPDDPDGGPEDIAFDTFSSFTWPGTRIADPALDSAPVADLPALLLTLPATTPEGLQAKAAAVLAISDADMFTGDCRLDEIELLRSVVRDAAGPTYRPVGEDFAGLPDDNSPATAPGACRRACNPHANHGPGQH
jgi:hypothetical protein